MPCPSTFKRLQGRRQRRAEPPYHTGVHLARAARIAKHRRQVIKLPNGKRPSGKRPSGKLPSGKLPSGKLPSGKRRSSKLLKTLALTKEGLRAPLQKAKRSEPLVSSSLRAQPRPARSAPCMKDAHCLSFAAEARRLT